LVVPRINQPEQHLRARLEQLVRQEVAAVQLRTVRSKGIDLAWIVDPPPQAVSGPPRRIAPNDDDLPFPRRPFALNAPEPLADLEDQVASAALVERSVDMHPEPYRSQRNGQLCDRSFLIRCHLRQRYLKRRIA